MSVSPEENVGESGHLLDWALVDSHGDLEVYCTTSIHNKTCPH